MPEPLRATTDVPTVFCLHFLGGSAREWVHVASALRGARCVSLDLPGFGDAAQTVGYGVSEMATTIASRIRAERPHRWFVAGHSMGAKVVTVIARRIEDGTLDLEGFSGLLLLAGSPPSPEPMEEEQRRKMLGWFAGDAESSRAEAAGYIDQNSGTALCVEDRALAVADVLRMNVAAWRAWLEHGSREDWASRIGVIHAPTLVLAGADDGALGPEAQRSLMLPHFANVRLASFPATKHLLPLERAHEVAAAIEEHVRAAAYRDVIASDRVSANTRKALLERAQADPPQYVPAAMDAAALATLRAVVDRVIPQTGFAPIDLGARIDRQLASEAGDGWRFATLPPDARAYRDALATLDAASHQARASAFASLDESTQCELLTSIAESRFVGTGPLDAKQMRDWFEDLRADAVKAYLGHASTLARMGYSGFAYGGDGEPKSGFARIGPGEREAWEPVAAPQSGR